MCNHGRGEGIGTCLDASESDTVRALLHDLREPLAAILLLSASSSGDVEEKLNRISEQASWLSELVDSSLDGAAADDVRLLEAGAVADFVADRARASVKTSIAVESAAPVWAMARPVALARALGCVVDNAVRAAGPEGHVTITVGDCGEAVHLTVVDDGPGLGRVTRRTSLGLITTRAMVLSCKGTFRLGARPGGGATADITVPSGRGLLAAS